MLRFHPHVIQPPLPGRKPVEFEPCRGRPLHLAEDGSAATTKFIAVALLVLSVAKVEAPKERIRGQLCGPADVTTAVRFGVGKAK